MAGGGDRHSSAAHTDARVAGARDCVSRRCAPHTGRSDWKSILLLTMVTHNYEELAMYPLAILRAYAQKHDMSFWVGRNEAPRGIDKKWAKIYALRRALLVSRLVAVHEFVLLVDADSVPTHMELSIQQLVDMREQTSKEEGMTSNGACKKAQNAPSARRQLWCPKDSMHPSRRRPWAAINHGWMLFRVTARSLWIVDLWLNASQGKQGSDAVTTARHRECKRISRPGHNRPTVTQPVWSRCVAPALCRGEVDVLSSKRFGGPNSSHWPHLWMGSKHFHLLDHGNSSTSNTAWLRYWHHQSAYLREVWARSGSPPVVDLAVQNIDTHGFARLHAVSTDKRAGAGGGLATPEGAVSTDPVAQAQADLPSDSASAAPEWEPPSDSLQYQRAIKDTSKTIPLLSLSPDLVAARAFRADPPIEVVLVGRPVPPGAFSRWMCVGDLENRYMSPERLRTCIFRNVCHEDGGWRYYERQPQAALPVIYDHSIGQLSFPNDPAGFVPLTKRPHTRSHRWLHFSPSVHSNAMPRQHVWRQGLTALSGLGPSMVGWTNLGHVLWEAAYPLLVAMAQVGEYQSHLSLLLHSDDCLRHALCSRFANAFLAPLTGLHSAGADSGQIDSLPRLLANSSTHGVCFERLLVGGSFDAFNSALRNEGKEPLLELFRTRVLLWHGLNPNARPRQHRILLIDKRGSTLRGRGQLRTIANFAEVAQYVSARFRSAANVTTTTFADMPLASQMELISSTTVAVSPAGGISMLLPLALPSGSFVVLCNYLVTQPSAEHRECANCSWTMEAELWQHVRRVHTMAYQVRTSSDFPGGLLPKAGRDADIWIHTERLGALIEAALLYMRPDETSETALLQRPPVADDSRGPPSRAIVQISIDHPIACAARRYDLLQEYAQVTNATLLVVRSYAHPLLSGQPCGWQGDKNSTGKPVRFAKFWAVRSALLYYDEVLLFDDSVVLNHATPNIFTHISTSGVIGARDRQERERSCRQYGVPESSCSPGLEINSGLLLFRRREHLHMFDSMPCDEWARIGPHYDQPLFNAMLLKFAAKVHDLNRRRDVCTGKTKRPPEYKYTCFVAQGSLLSRMGNQSAAELCMAHVTRGAKKMRDQLLCQLPITMACTSGIR